MRAMPLLLTVAIAAAVLTAGPTSAQTASATVVPPTVVTPPPAPAAAAPADDEIVRTMYIMTGAMAGYMFAVMPVTMTAITAAVASGAASMWAYDYMLGPAAKANQATGR